MSRHVVSPDKNPDTSPSTTKVQTRLGAIRFRLMRKDLLCRNDQVQNEKTEGN